MQRKLHKRKQIKAGEALTVKEGLQLTALKEFRAYYNSKKLKKQVRAKGGELS